MDRKEAILRIKDHMEHHGIGKYPHLKLKEALDMAITALSPPNEPLTLGQLREMVDEPVYLYIYDTALDSGWHIIKTVTEDKIIFRGWNTVYVPISSIGKCFDFYAYPPAHIAREKWEPCEWCGSFGKASDNWVCTLEDDDGHTVTNNHIVVCATANYCPSCGRPLTEQAWAELVKRLRR